MGEPARRLMTTDEFLVWCQDQEETYELVDGVPVLLWDNGPEMMAGPTRRHARVTGNIYTGLRTRLSGSGCTPYVDQLAVRISALRSRRPDVIVDCSPGEDDDLDAADPAVVFEVISPSSRRNDLYFKPQDYKGLDAVRVYVVVETDSPLLKVWRRDADGRWGDDFVSGAQSTLDLREIGTELPLADIYEGVAFG